MKSFPVLALCIIFSVIVLVRSEEKYTNQYDNVNVDEILQSARLYRNYYNCVKTGKKCTPDGQKLREILPDALKTGCDKCTDVQKTQSRKVIRFLVKNKPNDFKELESIFDPEHQYRKKYTDSLKTEGIILPD